MPTLKSLANPSWPNSLNKFAREQLTTAAWHYLAGTDKSHVAQLRTKLDDVYAAFTSSKTDANGNVVIAKAATGLLQPNATHSYQGQEFFGTLETRPASDVAAWDCAGPYVRDELGLVLHLWVAQYPPMQQVAAEFGIEFVLSVTLAVNQERADPDALIQVSRILTELVSASAKTWERLAHEAAQEIDGDKRKLKQRWSDLQRRGVKARQDNADKGDCRRLAAYYKISFPKAGKGEVQRYVHDKINGLDYKKKLTYKTVGRLMAGYVSDAKMLRVKRET